MPLQNPTDSPTESEPEQSPGDARDALDASFEKEATRALKVPFRARIPPQAGPKRASVFWGLMTTTPVSTSSRRLWPIRRGLEEENPSPTACEA
jgi:hypothetical protein